MSRPSPAGRAARATRLARVVLALCACAALPSVPLDAATPPQEPAGAQADLDAAMQRVLRQRDSAPEADLQLLGRSRDAAALEVLFEVQPYLSSVASRVRLVQALEHFVGHPALEHRALERMLAIAGDESSPEVQRATVRAMAHAGGAARDYLAMVVDAPLADEIRILAMELHTAAPREKDFSWYREVWKPTPPPEPPKGRKPEPPPDPAVLKKPHRLRAIVVLAFKALAPELTDEELANAAREGGDITSPGSLRAGRAPQRLHALAELDRRGSKLAVEIARERFVDGAESSSTRVLAARILAKADGDAILDGVVELGAHRDAPTVLWRGLGDVVREFASPEYQAALVKRLGRSKGNEKRLMLAALADNGDGKVGDALRGLLADKDADLRAFAVEALARRKDVAALDDLEKRLARAKDPGEQAHLFRTIVELRRAPGGAEPAWVERLETTAKGADPALAVLALEELERVQGAASVPVHAAALGSGDWSVRLAAARGLERLRTKESVQHLVARLGEESGRLRIEMAEMLWSLTGQHFTVHADQWKRWWDERGSSLEPISVEERDTLAADRERRRQESATGTRFFGLQLDSQRVTFIIDVSGSMEERTRGRYVGQSGERRIAVAKTELLKVLDQLDGNTLFNIIVFSDRARPWQKELMRATPDQVEKAKAHVEKFIAGGGTNVYEALEIAFTDQALDTLFILSDGEPSVGDEIDPPVIRDHVRRWNIGRNVRIHTIAVGDDLPILRWLAEDTGGYHAHIP